MVEKKQVKKNTLALVLVLVLVAIGGVVGYLFYAPATLKLSVMDPPPEPYAQSIQAIYITFTKVEIHVANAGNTSGWHTINEGSTVNLLSVLNVSKLLGSSNLPSGKYTEIRFFASEAIVKINGSNVTYTIPSGTQTGIKVQIANGGFRVYGGQTVNLQLDIAFKNSEILNNPTKTLVPVASARVV